MLSHSPNEFDFEDEEFVEDSNPTDNPEFASMMNSVHRRSVLKAALV